METDGTIKYILMVSEKPVNYRDYKKPHVDDDGDLWIDGILIYRSQIWGEVEDFTECFIDNYRPATKEETKLYWRYHKAWKLMG